MKKVLSVLLSLVLCISAAYAVPVSAQAASVGRVSGLKSTSITTTSVKLKWKRVKKATGYQVYYSTTKNRNYKKIKTLNKNKKTSVTVPKLKPGKTYYFKVRAIRKKTKGTFSKTLRIKTKYKWGTITKVKVKKIGVSDGYVGYICYLVDFNSIKGADGYQVQYYWNGEERIFNSDIKNNRFYYSTQDISPTMKVRAYKFANGKKSYGPWKGVNLNKTEYDGKISESSFYNDIVPNYEDVGF